MKSQAESRTSTTRRSSSLNSAASHHQLARPSAPTLRRDDLEGQRVAGDNHPYYVSSTARWSTSARWSRPRPPGTRSSSRCSRPARASCEWGSRALLALSCEDLFDKLFTKHRPCVAPRPIGLLVRRHAMLCALCGGLVTVPTSTTISGADLGRVVADLRRPPLRRSRRSVCGS
jgi:hypothetical protein